MDRLTRIALVASGGLLALSLGHFILRYVSVAGDSMVFGPPEVIE